MWVGVSSFHQETNMNRVFACRLALSAVILIFTSLPCAGLHAGVVVNEIMYNLSLIHISEPTRPY